MNFAILFTISLSISFVFIFYYPWYFYINYSLLCLFLYFCWFVFFASEVIIPFIDYINPAVYLDNLTLFQLKFKLLWKIIAYKNYVCQYEVYRCILHLTNSIYYITPPLRFVKFPLSLIKNFLYFKVDYCLVSLKKKMFNARKIESVIIKLDSTFVSYITKKFF